MRPLVPIIIVLVGGILPVVVANLVTANNGVSIPPVSVFLLIAPSFLFIALVSYWLSAPSTTSDGLELVRGFAVLYSFAGAAAVTFGGLSEFFRTQATTGTAFLFGTMIASTAYALFGLPIGSAMGMLTTTLREKHAKIGSVAIHIPFLLWLARLVS